MTLIDLVYLITLIGAVVALLIVIIGHARNNKVPFFWSFSESIDSFEKLPRYIKIIFIISVLMFFGGNIYIQLQ
jgi:hypothetical protein